MSPPAPTRRTSYTRPRRRRRQAPGGLEDRARHATRCRASRSATCPAAFDRLAQLRAGRRHDRRAARPASPTSQAAGATMVPMHGGAARARPADRHAHRQPHRGGLAAVLRPPGRPAVPHRGGDPRPRRRCCPYNRQTIAAPAAHDRGRHPSKIFVQPRRLQGAHQDLDGHQQASTPSSTRASAPTSTTTTGRRRSPRDRNSGVPTSNAGLPTLVLPVGANPHGDPMSLQFVGRAFDDAKCSASATRSSSSSAGRATWRRPRRRSWRVVTRRARAGRRHGAGDAGADARRARHASARSPRAWTKEYAAATTANVISTAGDATLSIADPSARAGHLVNGTFSLPAAAAGGRRRSRRRSRRGPPRSPTTP